MATMRSLPVGSRDNRLLAGAATYGLLAILLFFMLAPFAYMVTTALKPAQQVYLYPIQWLPNPFMWSNFPAALDRLTLRAFLNSVIFTTAIVLGQIDSKPVHIVGAALLVGVYVLYVRRTLQAGGDADEEEELKPLYFDTSKQDPPNTFQIVAQAVAALALIIGGAELFVTEITKLADDIGVSALVLSLIIAPLATELPEKINSVIWMRRDKDQLAVGNVTGAMAFQGTIPVALGLVVTEWQLDRFATAAGCLALGGAGLAYWRLEKGTMNVPAAVGWAVLFLSLIVFVIVG